MARQAVDFFYDDAPSPPSAHGGGLRSAHGGCGAYRLYRKEAMRLSYATRGKPLAATEEGASTVASRRPVSTRSTSAFEAAVGRPLVGPCKALSRSRPPMAASASGACTIWAAGRSLAGRTRARRAGALARAAWRGGA